MRRFSHRKVGVTALRAMLAIGIIVGWALPLSASGQEKTAEGQALLTLEKVERLRQEVEKAAGLEPEIKDKVLETYDKALAQLKAAAEWSEKAAAFDRAREEAPKLVEAVEKALKAPLPKPQVDLPEDISLYDLEQRLLQEKLDLEALNEELSRLEGEIKRRRERRKTVPQLLASARQRLLEAREREVAKGTGPPELLNAQAALLDATVLAAEAEIACLKRELPSYEAREKLLTLRIDQALRMQTAREKELELWQERVRERRREEAERAAREAQEALLAATGASPGIRRLAEELAAENAALAEQRSGAEGILYKIEAVSRRLGETEGLLKKVQADFSSVRKRIEAGSLSAPIGAMLRQHRADLPALGYRDGELRKRRQEIERAQLKIIELREERRAISDVQEIVSGKMSGVDPSLPAYQRRRMERLLRELLWTKRDSLQSLLNDYTTYFEKLVELDTRERALLDTVESFTDFIDERILWIRSARPFQVQTISGLGPSVGWLLGPEHWGHLLHALRTDLSENLPAYLLVALLLIGLLAGRRRMALGLQRIHEAARNPRCTDFRPTLEALLLTLPVTAFWPAVIGFLGWRLCALGGPAEFSNAIGRGLEITAVVYLTLEIPRQALRPEGLGRIHFGWSGGWLDDIYRLLGRSFAVVLPAVFVIGAVESQPDLLLKASLGRVTLFVLMLTIAILSWRMLRSVVRGRTGSGATQAGRIRFQRLWSLLALGVPLGIVAVSELGYSYAALQLSLRLHATACLVIAVLILQGMILRWLLLARRRLAIEENRKRWEALAKKASGAGEAESQKPQEELDLTKLQVQTNRLLRGFILFTLLIGIWLIWVDVLTALGILREVELWHTTREISQTLTDAEGKTTVQALQEVRAVTLADLLLALVILLMTFLATRNLPGILQVVLLQQFGLGTGERHAISTMAQYTVFVIGAALIFNILGISWGSIQWLVAALGVGIGFGLQEIVANFISGLILLFERPIRVGDAVTVGDLSGTVSRIRIRATSITGWDRKELIVPNKEFITGRLVNWTLSDTVIRVEIPVGIAYGSDTEKATELLLQVARSHPKVLKEPAPVVLFLAFGSSSLDFELRAYTNYETVLSVRHDLHMAVDRAFRQAGIEIAFPQQDLHIRSVEDVFPLTTSEPAPKK